MTPIGTGAGKIPIEVFAEALAEDTVQYMYWNAIHLNEILIVCNNAERAEILMKKFQE